MTEQNTPLAGLRVLDLGRYQAGPRCALMFARMGAEVIKVEALNGDESRRNGPTVRGQSAYWVQYNFWMPLVSRCGLPFPVPATHCSRLW